MTGVEAWTLMLTQGAKIRRTTWNEGAYIHVAGDAVLNQRDEVVFASNSTDVNAGCWELYAEHTVTLPEAIACVMEGGAAMNGYFGILCYDFDEREDLEIFFYDGKERCGASCLPADGWTVTRGPS